MAAKKNTPVKADVETETVDPVTAETDAQEDATLAQEGKGQAQEETPAQEPETPAVEETPVQEEVPVEETPVTEEPVATEKAKEPTPPADPFDDVRMTLEQFLMHVRHPMRGAPFAVGVLKHTVGMHPRQFRDWKAAYTKHIGELP